MRKIKGKDIFNGAFGNLIIDGEILAEVKSSEANIENEFEEVTLFGGKKAQKLKTSVGKGKFVIVKVDSFEHKKFLKNNINMKTTEFGLEFAIDDPDATGAERISLPVCEFTGNFPLFNFSREELIEKEFEYWFDKDLIDTPELA